MSFLPYGRQSIDQDDIDSVVMAMRADLLTTGSFVREFEDAFAAKVGARFAVSCSSGTAALHLAAAAAGLDPSDEVIVPTLTFLASANAPMFTGARLKFADVDPENGLVEEGHITRALAKSKDPSCVVAVHLNGQSVDLEMLSELARVHDLTIIEDASHALGTSYETADGTTSSVGSCAHSDLTTFSFHPVKTITTGEGGMVTTNDDDLHRRLLSFRNHGIVREARLFEARDQAFAPNGDANPWYYEMEFPGFNYRISDINCALGLSQLKKLDRFVRKRRVLAQLYDDLIGEMAPLIHPVSRQRSCIPCLHLYVVLIDFEAVNLSRYELMTFLRDRDIGTQVHYLPLHRQPWFRRLLQDQDFPGADQYYEKCLSLPFFPGMTESDVMRVVDALHEAFAE